MFILQLLSFLQFLIAVLSRDTIIRKKKYILLNLINIVFRIDTCNIGEFKESFDVSDLFSENVYNSRILFKELVTF